MVNSDAFVYDAIYRLTGVKYGVPDIAPLTIYNDYLTYDNKEDFTLDGVGNRTQLSTASLTTDYSVNELNQYTQINGQSLSYDLNGNLKDDGTNTYIYDYANRLVKVIRKADNETIGEYKYDALGRRIEKITRGISFKNRGNENAYHKIGIGQGKGQGRENGQGIQNALNNVSKIIITTTLFYYDGARCIEERDGSDVLLRQYVFGNRIDEVLQRTDYDASGQIINEYYFHENSLGSIYAVTDVDGLVKERYKYTVYGRCTFFEPDGITPRTESNIGNRILFTGREFDNETGLYYYRARYYSPELGRFLQCDPMEDDKLSNLYTYVENNPINYSDPFGTDKNRGQTNATNPHTEPPTPTPHAAVAPPDPTPVVNEAPCNKWEEYMEMMDTASKLAGELHVNECNIWQRLLYDALRDLASKRSGGKSYDFKHWDYDALNVFSGPLGLDKFWNHVVAIWQIGTDWTTGTMIQNHGGVSKIPRTPFKWRRNWDHNKDANANTPPPPPSTPEPPPYKWGQKFP